MFTYMDNNNKLKHLIFLKQREYKLLAECLAKPVYACVYNQCSELLSERETKVV
jgi:hypothetical protein